MKSSGIGGQAVLEGVMMKNQDEYAVAVRIQNNDIVVEKNKYVSVTKKFPILGIPIVRGVINFVESLVIGTKTLTFSSSFFEDEEEDDKKKKTDDKNHKNANKNTSKTNTTSNQEDKKSASDSIMMALTVCASIILAVGIFMLLPFYLGDLFSDVVKSSALRALVEGVIRIVIFIGYIAAISQMKDIKRVFMYHGAEHKTINCVEHGYDLTVENVRKQSKEHKRCGTSFMLIVMVVSVIFFIFIKVDTIWLRMLYRILLVPVIAGVSYEFIRLAGRSDNKVVEVISKPGLWLQGLTTREPDDDMIEVAIKSVEAVFDWKKYLEENKEQFTAIKKGNKVTGNTAKVAESNISHKNSKVNHIVKGTVEASEEKEMNILTEVNLDRFDKKLIDEESDMSDMVDKKLSTNKKVSDSSKQTKQSSKKHSKNNKAVNKNSESRLVEKEQKVIEEASKELASTSIENVVRVNIDCDDEEEDDEILRALDRYFDTPNAIVLEEDDQDSKED